MRFEHVTCNLTLVWAFKNVGYRSVSSKFVNWFSCSTIIQSSLYCSFKSLPSQKCGAETGKNHWVIFFVCKPSCIFNSTVLLHSMAFSINILHSCTYFDFFGRPAWNNELKLWFKWSKTEQCTQVLLIPWGPHLHPSWNPCDGSHSWVNNVHLSQLVDFQNL